MLGKLFKHEWRAISKLLLLLHGFLLIFSVISRIFFQITGDTGNYVPLIGNNFIELIGGLIIFATVLSVCCIGVFTWVYIAFRFYKNVFTDQGYLTNTLPVTPTQIILSKGLTGLLWSIIDVVAIIAALLIIFANAGFFRELPLFFANMFSLVPHAPLFFWLLLLLLLLSPFLMIAHMYFCVAVGSLLPNHKVLGAVGTYIVSYIVIQTISIILIGLVESFSPSQTVTIGMSQAQITTAITNALNPFFLFTIVMEVLGILIFFFVTRYIMTRRLNLE